MFVIPAPVKPYILLVFYDSYARLTCPNHISLQDHPFICPIETSLIPLLVYRNGIQSAHASSDHRLLFIPSFDYLYLYHIPLIPKTPHPPYLYPSLIFFVSYGVLISPNATPYPRFGPLLSQRPPKGKKGKQNYSS